MGWNRNTSVGLGKSKLFNGMKFAMYLKSRHRHAFDCSYDMHKFVYHVKRLAGNEKRPKTL